MAGEQYVVDIEDKNKLKDQSAKEAVDGDSNFDFKNFDEMIEQSFQDFVKESKSKFGDGADRAMLQREFNTRLDEQFVKLDKMKNREIEKAIIAPTTFELTGFQTITDLQFLKDDVRDSTAQSVIITGKASPQSIQSLKPLNNKTNFNTYMKELDKGELEDLLDTIRTTNFKERDFIVDCLNSGKKEDIRKIQYLLIGKKDEYIPRKKQEGVLSKWGTDGLMGTETFNALKSYVNDPNNKIEDNDNPGDNGGGVSLKGYTPIVADDSTKIDGGSTTTVVDPITSRVDATKKSQIDQYEHEINGLTEIDETKAREVVQKQKEAGKQAINFGSLEKLSKEVAVILASFPGTLNFGSLKKLDQEVLSTFVDENAKCTVVQFPGGAIQKVGEEVLIILKDGTTYTKIADNVCSLLVNGVYNTPVKQQSSNGTPSGTGVSGKYASSSVVASGKVSSPEKISYVGEQTSVVKGINNVFKEIYAYFPSIEITADTDDPENKSNLRFSKKLLDYENMEIVYDPSLENYIGIDQDAFIVPINIQVGLVKSGDKNIFVLGAYEPKDSFKSLNETKVSGQPSKYNGNVDFSFVVTSTSDAVVGGEGEGVKKDIESKNEYHNLEDDRYGGVISEEVVASNYEAIIDYMEGQDNDNLIQAFQRLKINPNNIANALAQILEEYYPTITKGNFKKEHISKQAMKQLGRNEKMFVNEKKNLVKILNEVDTDKLQQFINEMKVFNDIRELQKTKKFIEYNKVKIISNPFLVLSDFNRSGDIGRLDEGKKHGGRTSEQAMYDVFVSGADTTEEKGIKKIVDGPKTSDLVKGFVSMIQSVGDSRYENIEADFSEGYTMENLGKYIVEHPETLVLYQQTLNKLSYNVVSGEISEIVSYSKRQTLIDKDMQKIEQLSTNRDDVQVWFNKQMENKDFKQAFGNLSAEEQSNFMGNMAAYLGEHGLLREIVGRFGVSSKTGVTVDNLDAVNFEWHALRDDAGIGPRFSFGPLENGVILHLDVPLANLTANFDLNRSIVENSVINGNTPVHQLYTRLGANIGGGVSIPKGSLLNLDEYQAYLSAAIEGAIGWKADYKKGIELSSRNFGNVLQDQIFNEPDFSSKEGFEAKAKQSIENILKSKEKADKNLKKFIENNKQEMFNCIENVSAMLDVFGAFDPSKKNEHKQILLDSIMKGVVESVKDKNLGELDGKSKLTRFGVRGQYGGGINVKELKNVRSFGDLKKVFHWGRSVGLEATVSSRNMIYLPDNEKLEFMDAQLKNGESIKPLGEGIRTNSLENVRKAIMESLSENSIPNKVESNDKGQIKISVTDNVLKKYGKKNIYELFNIYVNPDKKDNVAISNDGKTLILGGKNLECFSVATRRYFDEFAVYLMIGGKGIDGCENNKINGETINEYNTQEHIDGVSGFEFTPKANQNIETQELTYSSILSENGITSGFKNIEDALSKIDDQKWNDYVRFMESTCDLDGDIIENSDYEDAFSRLISMIDASIKSGKLNNNIKNDIVNVQNMMNGITDFDQKAFVVDRFKMIFSLVPETDTVNGLKSLAMKRGKTYESLKGYATDGKEFPLAGKSYRDKLINSLGNGKVERIPDSNLVGMTAFYRRGHVDSKDRTLLGKQLKQAYGYSMTEIGGTDYLGSLYSIEDSDLQKTKDWFIKNLEKSQIHKNILKKTFSDKIGTEITDEQLLQLLKGEEIDIDKGVKKVTIDVDYVFYLLGECANESIGVKLGSLKIVYEQQAPVEYDDILDVGIDGQTLTKVESLNQNDISGKFSILHGVQEPETTEPDTTEPDTTEPEIIDPTSDPVIPEPPTIDPTSDPGIDEPVLPKVPKEGPGTPSSAVVVSGREPIRVPKEGPGTPSSAVVVSGREPDPSPNVEQIVTNR